MPFAQENDKKRTERQRIGLAIALLLLFKLAMMGLFSSDYQNAMFEPFIKEFWNGLSEGRFNPYQSFYEQGLEMNFPYPPVMLMIMALSEGLCMLCGDMPLVLHNIIFKLPLLLMDCLVLHLLLLRYPEKKFYVVWIYFSSPVVIYATYMHSQLDIIPMTLLFASLYILTQDRAKWNIWLSALLLGLALLSKLHIVAILPLIAIYLYKRSGLRAAAVYLITALLITAVGIWPFFGDGFISGVLFNSTQSALFALFFSYGNLKLYLSVTVVMVVYFYALNLNFINDDLLFGLVGLIFSIFLVLCAPMPGWYMWVILFIADFIIRFNGKKQSLLLYLGLSALYVTFFAYFHRSANGVVDLYYLSYDCSVLKIKNEQACNVAFSLLSANMAYMIFLMHKYNIAGNSFFRFHDAAFVIGICGDSGTGKSTLQNSIRQLFTPQNFLCIEGDGDHKWERGDRNWEQYTHLNPKANYLYRQAIDIKCLKYGESVKRVEYDHSSGRFTTEQIVRPCRFISISGLHILFLPQLRDIVDLKIYTCADEALRVYWKMQRDTGERGHSPEEIMQQIRVRYADAEKYIYPQEEFADIIIHYFLEDAESGSVGMELKINTQIDLEKLVSAMKRAGVSISYEYSKDFRYQIIRCLASENTQVKASVLTEIYHECFQNGYDILSCPFTASDPADGIKKLILIQSIQTKIRTHSL